MLNISYCKNEEDNDESYEKKSSTVQLLLSRSNAHDVWA